MKKLLILFAILAINPAYAWEATGKIIRISPTYAFDRIVMRLDSHAGACQSGSWLFFHGAGATTQEKQESLKAIYSGLLASMYSDKNVVLYGADQGCVVHEVHLIPN